MNNEQYIMNINSFFQDSKSYEDGKKIMMSKHDLIFSEKEIELILKTAINNVYLELMNKTGEDARRTSLVNKCDFFQKRVGSQLEILGIDVHYLDTNKIFSEDIAGHSFLIVKFLSKESDILFEEKIYIIDPTYRQFFLKENCNQNKYLLKGNHILLAPHPGYYFVRNKEQQKKVINLLENGFCPFTDDIAKVYFDSFLTTKRGRFDNFNLNATTDITGKLYKEAIIKLISNESKKVHN